MQERFACEIPIAVYSYLKELDLKLFSKPITIRIPETILDRVKALANQAVYLPWVGPCLKPPHLLFKQPKQQMLVAAGDLFFKTGGGKR